MSDISEHLKQHAAYVRGAAKWIGHHYRLSWDLTEDLIQEGMLVLWQAHGDGYDHERGASLATYASGPMLWAMRRYAKAQADQPTPYGGAAELADLEREASFRGRNDTIGVLVLGRAELAGAGDARPGDQDADAGRGRRRGGRHQEDHAQAA